MAKLTGFQLRLAAQELGRKGGLAASRRMTVEQRRERGRKGGRAGGRGRRKERINA
jgi:hypothetical protein